jgi:bifunctional DNA-binding transcriptional regulator/antitoxin component of YhaV-PrlF toxin-antitoxin module
MLRETQYVGQNTLMAAASLEQGNYPCYNAPMPKVTSKLQITLPKALATQYDIKPGDEIQFEGVAGAIRMIPAGRGVPRLSLEERRRLFDESEQRLKARWQWLEAHLAAHPQIDNEAATGHEPSSDDMKDHERRRGWTRASLYDRDIGRSSKSTDRASEGSDQDRVDEER